MAYGLAVLGPAAMTALAVALAPWTGGRAGHLLMAPVALAAWRGGWGPGLVATALGALALDYFFEEPPGSFAVESPNTLLNMLAYALVASLIAWGAWGNARLAAARDAARAAQATAEAAVRLRDDFLAAVSHDLRSPLTAIKAAAELGRRRLERPGPAPAGELAAELARVEAAAEKMARQINELLDVARLQAGQRLELHRRPVDLVALARAAAEEHGRTSLRHRIRVEASPEAVVGAWDGFRLERVLDNLLSNAVKYSPAGGEIAVCVAVERDGAWARLAVRDAGVGIPAADLPRVFERFHRAGNVGAVAGTGIGLAGARQIVEQHGGTLAVQSREGAGSTFTVRLPLASGGAAPHHRPDPSADRPR